MQFANEDVKVLFTDKMIVYTENPKEFTLLELISELCKAEGFMVNIKKSIVSIYQLQKKLENTT